MKRLLATLTTAGLMLIGSVALAAPANAALACNPAYPTVCLTKEVDCGQIKSRNFPTNGSDPYRLDSNKNKIACEDANLPIPSVNSGETWPAQPSPSVSPSASKTVKPSPTPSKTKEAETLPVTGPNNTTQRLVLGGSVLLVVGALSVFLFRRRRNVKFVAE